MLNLTFPISGAVLKGLNASVSWDPELQEKEEFPRANKLIVKQLLLGVEANKDEYNVVEVCLENHLVAETNETMKILFF